MDNYKITQYSVNHILNFVQCDQIAIPEIQRPFVWKGKGVLIFKTDDPQKAAGIIEKGDY